MALRLFASDAVSVMRLRCLTPSFLFSQSNSILRSYASAASEGRLFSKSHEWVDVDGEMGTVGITEFAQNELGEVVFVDLPEVGSSVSKGETFGVVESVKAASDVYSPVSGEVVEANQKLQAEPGLVNSGPFTDGWMLKVRLSNPSELDSMLNAEAYAKHCEESAH